MAASTYKQTVAVISLCLSWYTVSSANGVIGKVILNEFPYPMTITMIQIFSVVTYLFPIVRLWRIPKRPTWSLKYWLVMLLPLAFGKSFSSIASHISIWKVPVSYTQTVKSIMPLFTVILTRLVLNEAQSKQVYLSIVTIIAGVAVATATELSFSTMGLICALAAAFGFALQNIYSKKCLKDTGIHHLRLLHCLSIISATGLAPVWLWYDLGYIWNDVNIVNSSHVPRVVALLLIDGLLNLLQNMIAFTVIAMLSPLSYSIVNASKRIVIISTSLFFLGNPVSASNVCGMSLACVGVVMYNKAKYDQRQAEKKRVSALPLMMLEDDEQQRYLQSNVDELLNTHRTTMLRHSKAEESEGEVFDRLYLGGGLTTSIQTTPLARSASSISAEEVLNL